MCWVLIWTQKRAPLVVLRAAAGTDFQQEGILEKGFKVGIGVCPPKDPGKNIS